MKHRGVFFDLYGTLLVYGDMRVAWSGWLDALHRQLTGYGLALAKNELAEQSDGFFSRPEPALTNDGLTVYERRLLVFCRELGFDISKTGIRQAAAMSVAVWHESISLDPQALSLLRDLQTTHRLGLVSNFDHPPAVHRLLNEYGLMSFFSTVIVSGDVGVKKPDPQIFSLALEQSGLSAAEVIHVGDSSEDVLGAQAAGIVPIMIDRNGEAGGGREAVDFRVSGEQNDQTLSADQDRPLIISCLDQIRTICKP